VQHHIVIRNGVDIRRQVKTHPTVRCPVLGRDRPAILQQFGQVATQSLAILHDSGEESDKKTGRHRRLDAEYRARPQPALPDFGDHSR
jgi:hypothetical protein